MSVIVFWVAMTCGLTMEAVCSSRTLESTYKFTGRHKPEYQCMYKSPRGVMLSVLASGPKVRGFKLGLGDVILRAIKIRSTPSFGGEVKPSDQCQDFSACRKITSKCEQRYFGRPNSSFPSPFLLICYRLCWLDCQWPLVDESVSPCRYHSTMVLHAHISPGGWTIGPLVAAVQRRGLTPSTWSS
jgi:hypothetical protein